MLLWDARMQGWAAGGEAPVGEAPVGEAPMQNEGASAGANTGRIVWTPEATGRLERVPSFVRGMVKRIYTDWAREKGVTEITPESMDRARTELGLEGM